MKNDSISANPLNLAPLDRGEGPHSKYRREEAIEQAQKAAVPS